MREILHQNDSHTWAVGIETHDGFIFAATGFSQEEALQRVRRLVWEYYETYEKLSLTGLHLL